MGREGHQRLFRYCPPTELGRLLIQLFVEGLQRVRDGLENQMRELQKTRPRVSDDSLELELTQIESALQVARDDLVGFPSLIVMPPTLMILQSACKLKLTGVKNELKNIDKSLKENGPKLRKVYITQTFCPLHCSLCAVN